MTSADTDHLPSFALTDQVVLITGASRGIGAGLVESLVAAGATVAVSARDLDAARSIARAAGAASAHRLDATDLESIDTAVSEVVTEHGRLDVLVANAGLGANHPATEVTEADWDDMMDVNAKGMFFSMQAAGRAMLEQGSGRIVAISSQASVVGIRDHAVYCASKGAVNQMVRVLALEWGARGVTVNAVAPTFIHTPGTAERLDDPDYLAGVLDRIPLGRVGTISDVAAAVIYLASPAGAMVTGHILTVDGGWTAQ